MAMKNFEVTVQKIGRLWVQLRVKGTYSCYNARIAKTSLPDVKEGEKLTIQAEYQTDKSGKATLVVLNTDEQRAREIARWWGYVEEKWKMYKYIYENGVFKLHSMDCYDYDKQIDAWRQEIEERKAKEAAAREEERAKARAEREVQYTYLSLEHRVYKGDVIELNGKVYRVISCQYQDSDGWSFGVLQEHWYRVRALEITDTPEGQAKLAEVKAEKERREAERAHRKHIKGLVRAIENSVDKYEPEGFEVSGEIVLDTFNAYGGGSQIIVNDDTVYLIHNNGADGDNWGADNVKLGNSSHIGYRGPLTDDVKVKVAELKSLLEGKSSWEISDILHY